MNWVSVTHLLAQVTSATLGFLVFFTNPRRRTNQFFLVLTVLVAIWLGCLSLSFSGLAPGAVLWCVRGCMSSVSLIPMCMDWLRVSIVQPNLPARMVLLSSPVWLGISLLFSILALTPCFVIGTIQHPGAIHAIPEPVYSNLFFVYLAFHLCNLCLLCARLFRDAKSHKGIQRIELQLILLGVASSFVTGIVVALIMPLFTGSSQSAQFIPLSVICMYIVIAYGIATRRIMDVAYLLRIVTAYSLLIVYLIVLYGACWWVTNFILRAIGLHPGPLPSILGTLAVAFSLAPVHGVMQRFANRLFIHFAPINMNDLVQSANHILRFISTVDDLLKEFVSLIKKSIGVEHVFILLMEEDALIQRYPRDEGTPPIIMSKHDLLPIILSETGEALVPEAWKRLRPSLKIAEACRHMEQLQSVVAIGIQSKEGLEGILLLGHKVSRRIYNAPELQALQFSCNQMAVSLTNARLYTQIQDSKIYTDILVDNLASGVIAAGNNGLITVFNREAQRLTGLNSEKVLKHPITFLPPALAEILEETLRLGNGVRDQDITLHGSSNNEIPIRISSSVFYGHVGKILGAFMVINDLSVVKQLEMQLRRTDRLASLGTLAAGMAHEIKNPLVSIKTFTQLLPERYEDADFRDTFFSLVGGEVKRIDGIVNQLLRFSKPAQPILTPTSLHDILDNALKLMHQQMIQKDIHSVRNFAATGDSIQADGGQLTQAFINFFLNAIESMEPGGTLSLSTTRTRTDTLPSVSTDHSEGRGIIVTIADTGEGIDSVNLSHIFDPFFTTKSQGTGLGLSVAHGIIQEHGGVIDVKSEPNQGTTFTIVFPLINNKGGGV